jgi:catechol 2,3-dioxygenase-like lactoylglutathione lyase family enzyme
VLPSWYDVPNSNEHFSVSEAVMREQIETMLENYENGQVSRRAFVQTIAALVTAPVVLSSETPKSLFKAVNLNHVTLAVSDFGRTIDFYQSILGIKAYKQDEIGVFLGVGEHFIGIDLASKENVKVGIDHFCIGVENFDVDKARQTLAAKSIPTFTEFGSGVHFHDPDGNKVQISAPDYRG